MNMTLSENISGILQFNESTGQCNSRGLQSLNLVMNLHLKLTTVDYNTMSSVEKKIALSNYGYMYIRYN